MPAFTGNLEQYQAVRRFRVVQKGTRIDCQKHVEPNTIEVHWINLKKGTILSCAGIVWHEHLSEPTVLWSDLNGVPLEANATFSPTLRGKWNGLPHTDYLVPVERIEAPIPVRPMAAKLRAIDQKFPKTSGKPRSDGKNEESLVASSPWVRFFKEVWRLANIIPVRRLKARLEEAKSMTQEEFGLALGTQFSFYAEDPEQPLTTEIYTHGIVFLYPSWKQAQTEAQGEGKVHLVANLSRKPLLLDTPKQLADVWKASGADVIAGPFRPDRVEVLADWARAFDYDSIVIQTDALQNLPGGAEGLRVPLTLMLRPEDAPDLGTVEDDNLDSLHQQAIDLCALKSIA